MTAPSVSLLPCPFCGGEAEIERVGTRRQSTIYQCTSCACTLETGEEWGHGKQWNTRATPPAPTPSAVRAPTSEMLLAGARSIGNSMGKPNFVQRAQACWDAMWNARDGIMEVKPLSHATALLPDAAAIRAELSDAQQEAADSLRVLDAIAEYVGCPHDEELTVDHVRQHYMKLENAAQRQGVEDAGRIANAEAHADTYERERDEARQLVAEANNSLFGSQGYFHSLNGGEFDRYHLARAIENLKSGKNTAQATAIRATAFEEAAKAVEELDCLYINGKRYPFGGIPADPESSMYRKAVQDAAAAIRAAGEKS